MPPLWRQHKFDFCSFGVGWCSSIQNELILLCLGCFQKMIIWQLSKNKYLQKKLKKGVQAGLPLIVTTIYRAMFKKYFKNGKFPKWEHILNPIWVTEASNMPQKGLNMVQMLCFLSHIASIIYVLKLGLGSSISGFHSNIQIFISCRQVLIPSG